MGITIKIDSSIYSSLRFIRNVFIGRLLSLIFFLCVSISLTPTAEAAGLILYEMGTPDVGTAAAGRAALAEDASTAFGNAD